MVHDHLVASAARWPDKVAVIAGDQRLTYRELDRASNRCARGLVAVGVQRGDRIGIQLENSLETVIAIYGALKAGAAILMLNPSTKPDKLGYVLEDSRARVLILGARSLDAAAATLAALPGLASVVPVGAGAAAATACPSVPWSAIHDDQDDGPLDEQGIDLDLAALLYTSGSTGDPKGVMLTHLNIGSAVRSIASYLALTPDDVVLNVLPLSFGYGLTQLFPTLMAGGTVVLERGILFPHVTLSQMAAHRATGFALVPTIATMLLGLDLSKYDLSSLRYITNAGAGLPPELAGRLRRQLPDVRLYLMYGQTECLRASYLEPEQVDMRPDSVGRGIPNQEMWIADEAGVPVGPDVVGELVIRGPHVMAGYWQRPDETERKLRAGRLPGERVLHTGDLFRRDEAGYYYFVARQDDIIKSRGEKVSPREVENALYKMPEVLEAAVAGVPDALLGESIKAYVVVKPGATLNERQVKRHCAMLLEEYMVPAAVEFRSELPKNERGKIVKRELLTTGLAK